MRASCPNATNRETDRRVARAPRRAQHSTIEGLAPEPSAGGALGAIGVEALIAACGPETAAVMRLVRRGLHDTRRYFEWRRIPLCFLVEGRLRPVDGALVLDLGDAVCALDALFGKSLRPMSDAGPAGADWW